jgi:hypothetical protein
VTLSPSSFVRASLLALAFCLVATLNSAGYRFGVSDQAFYVPAIQRHLTPDLFPRDRAVFEAQDKLNVVTRVAAAVISATGLPIHWLFAGIYLAALLLMAGASVFVASQLGLSGWGQIALLAAMTLRHRVGLTGVNTLEGYGHPRMLAFAIGLLGVGAFLRSRVWLAIGLVATAAIVHPTTAVWFSIWIGVAIVVTDARWRVPAAAVAAAGIATAIWAWWFGPLAARLAPMDAEWRAVIASKDYLFPNLWPVSMWLVAALYVAVVAIGFFARRAAGRLHPREPGLVAGAAALVAIFALTLPAVAAGGALAVQFQIGRLFWMLDVFGTIYAVGAAVDGLRHRATLDPITPRAARRAAAVALLLIAIATGRGVWVMWVQHPGRPIAELTAPHDDWQDAMGWLASSTPPTSHVLADPGHAWRYGTCVRVSASRDVYLEELKDTAMAMYSRPLAMRVAERSRGLGSFDDLTPDSVRALAARFDLDYLVTERTLALPLTYRNARFAIYRLR